MQLSGRLTQMELWRAVTRFDKGKIHSGIAIRNTVGVVLPVIIGAALGNASAGVVGALGALNVSYSDSRDPYITRARRMLFSSVLVGVAVSIGAISGESNLAAVVATALWAFVAGMMVVLGQRAGDLGITSLVTLVVFAARRLTPLEALESGLIAFGGGALQTLLAVVFWPVHRYEPERRTIGSLYGTLADLAILPAGVDSPPPGSAQITETQNVPASLARDQGIEAERYIFLLNQAERIRLSLLTLRRLLRRIGRDPEGSEVALALERILVAASAALKTISQSVMTGTTAVSLEEFRFQVVYGQAPSAFLSAAIRDAGQQIDALGGQLRAAAGLISASASSVSNGGPHPRPDKLAMGVDSGASFARLRANLSFQSTAFRHAVRLAVCVGLGDAIGRDVNLERTYWLPMTIAIVLRPDFTATFSRGILRIAGTLAGLLVATGLFHFLPGGRTSEIALLAAFVFLLRWAGPANYGIFVTALSAFIVLLIAITGVSPKAVIAARALNTVLGGAIALAAYGIWPTWEHTRVGPVLADLMDAYQDYFHEVMNAYIPGGDADLDGTRMKARLARSNTEALMGRIVAEPGITIDKANLLSAILASSHNFVRAVMALESALDHTRPEHVRPATIEFVHKVETTLEAFAKALRSSEPLAPQMPDLRQAHNAILASAGAAADQYTLVNTETDRITTSVNTLGEQIALLLRA
jgi:uncharacterized membrane protein YccC